MRLFLCWVCECTDDIAAHLTILCNGEPIREKWICQLCFGAKAKKKAEREFPGGIIEVRQGPLLAVEDLTERLQFEARLDHSE